MSSEELNNVEHIQTEDPLDDDNYDDMPGLSTRKRCPQAEMMLQ